MNGVKITPIRAALTIALVAAVTAGAADARGFISRFFRAEMNGSQEVPAISTAAEGEFRAVLSEDHTTLTYTLSYEALEGGTAPLFAHVHIGQPGVNGAVSFFLCGGGSKPACPDAPGFVNGTVTAADINGPTAQGIDPGEFDQVIAAMRMGITYANIHTTRWSGGEIRGLVRN